MKDCGFEMRLVASLCFLLAVLSCAGELSAITSTPIFGLTGLSHILLFLLAAAYDPLDPNGNITIKWDVMSWTPDGYVVITNSSPDSLFMLSICIKI